ncbi:MAG: hypothetical protein HYV09_37920 [Deltaproteobacteria bacterium]|nr:hypothetical protein [Deltaproteobacteria bacterium]
MTLAELREKYRRMRALRGERWRPDRDRRALRALAREFPGALAELDRLPPEVLEDRIATLDALIDHGGDPPPWARGWLLAHPALRGALIVKAWLAGRRVVDQTMRDELTRTLGELRNAEDAQVWLERIAELADPPNGKLVDVVFRDVAAALSLPDAHSVRELLMPREVVS